MLGSCPHSEWLVKPVCSLSTLTQVSCLSPTQSPPNKHRKMRAQNLRRVLKSFAFLLSPNDQGDCYGEWPSARDTVVVCNVLKLLERTWHKFLQRCKSSFFGSLFRGHELGGYAENFSRCKIPKHVVSPPISWDNDNKIQQETSPECQQS